MLNTAVPVIMANDPWLLWPVLAGVLFAAGVLSGRLLTRRKPAPDPEDDGHRHLELLRLREAAEASQAAAQRHARWVEECRAQLQSNAEHIRSLEEQVGTYLRRYALVKDTLKKEILHKSSLSTELAAATAETEALRARIRELQLSREPAPQASRRRASN